MEIYKLLYKNEKDKKYTRILGEDFFQRNKITGYFIYNNIKYKLKEKIVIKNLNEDEIKIEMRFFKIIYNKNSMFKDCTSLIQFSVHKNMNKEKISKRDIYDMDEEGNLINAYI